MASVSLKCQYAIRAVFELARRWPESGLSRLRDISKAQAIPARFLETILNHLRRSGLVESRRGKDGGFRIGRPPSEITVGEVVRCMEYSEYPVSCAAESPVYNCPRQGKCVFIHLWNEAKAAVNAVYDAKSFSDLLEDDERLRALGAIAGVEGTPEANGTPASGYCQPG